MGNMSYCRFRNTRNDFADCVYTLEDMVNEEINCEMSIDEKNAALGMYDLCKEYIEYYEELVEKDIL